MGASARLLGLSMPVLLALLSRSGPHRQEAEALRGALFRQVWPLHRRQAASCSVPSETYSQQTHVLSLGC